MRQYEGALLERDRDDSGARAKWGFIIVRVSFLRMREIRARRIISSAAAGARQITGWLAGRFPEAVG